MYMGTLLIRHDWQHNEMDNSTKTIYSSQMKAPIRKTGWSEMKFSKFGIYKNFHKTIFKFYTDYEEAKFWTHSNIFSSNFQYILIPVFKIVFL